MSRRGLDRPALLLLLVLCVSMAIGCTTPPPPDVPDVYAPWADAGMDAGRVDALVHQKCDMQLLKVSMLVP